MGVEIPLFPLGTVLFPHMPLRLHIFEERYRDMLRDCKVLGTSFGVVGIREGVEVGRQAATPYTVGTLAQIRSLDELDDGSYNVVVSGASRFLVAGISLGARTYLVGDITYLEDIAGDALTLDRLARRVRGAFIGYTHALGQLTEETNTDLELPDDPELLSYLVAASLQIETHHKQELLEVDSAEDRLALCMRFLRREGVLLEKSLARPERGTTTMSPN